MKTGPMVQLPLRVTIKRTRAIWLAAFAVFVLALVALAGSTSGLHAQSRIKHFVTMKAKGYPPVFGRDLWFTMAQNYDAGGQNGKYYMLYVTSAASTTVNIQVTGSSAQKFPIQKEQVVAFKIPLAWEVTSSGVVENKGIRVWSDNADLTAYLLSRNPATSDGMLIIPNIGWGKDYVVCGYTSLFELTFDYPSEFTVVANQDNTSIQVTPSWDIRASHQPRVVLHPRKVPFGEFFLRGQCVQYQLTQAENPDDWDVTGSLVSANVPVGVVGASECPNIPPDYAYCDHICDMIPPIRTWAKTYYTAPFIQRRGGDSFCAIASVDGQTIWRADNTGIHSFAQINKYQFFREADIDVAQKFYSDQPFLLVQYINSTTWPDLTGALNGGIGDPAMVVINSVEQYTPKIIFQTPTILGGQSAFTNFVNIIIPTSHEQTTKYDNVGISSAPSGSKIVIDNQYEAWRFVNQHPGTHTVYSDTGIGCYIYGYGSYDSYAWSGAFGSRTYNDPDTIPPVVDTIGQCFCAHVTTKDVHVNASKLSSYTLDSVLNMNYYPDPTFVAGTSRDSSYYDMCVIDSTQPASLQVTIYDMAGNATIVRSIYKPQTADIFPPVQNFGTGTTGQTTYGYDTIVNTGKTNFTLSLIKLLNGGRGFTIDPNNDLSPLTPGERRVIKLDFSPIQPQTVTDTIIFGDACVQEHAILVGNGGAPDFTPTGVDFGCILVGDSTDNTKVTVTNPSPISVKIDSIWVDDPAHFKYMGTLPILLPGRSQSILNLRFGFKPTAINPRYSTGVHFLDTKDNLLRSDSLFGCGIAPSAVFFADSVVTISCSGDATFGFTLESHSHAATTITQLKHTNNMFTNLQAVDQYNKTVSLPHFISEQDSKLFVTETFTAPAKTSGVFYDTIYAIDAAGQPVKQNGKDFVVATAIVHYREFAVDQTSIDFGTLAFGGATSTMPYKICNTAKEDVSIDQIIPNGIYKDAFTVNPALPLPVTLKPGECLSVDVVFDPKVHAVDSQYFTMRIQTDACTPQANVAAAGRVKFGVSTAQGFADPAIFACSNLTDKVQVTNANAPGVWDTIVNVTSSLTNFKPTPTLPLIVNGGGSTTFPVVFTPNPTGGVTNYTATITITLHDSHGFDTVLTTTVSSGAIGMNATISSIFAGTRTTTAGSTVTLPIDIQVQKNGLLAPLSDAGINGVKLIYHYDQDALDIGDIAAAVTNRYADWAVDKVNSNLNTAANTLTLYMTGATALADGVSKLGDINFRVMLTKNGTQRFNVGLDSAMLLNSGATAGCVASTPLSSDFGLVFACGDTTIKNLLAGDKFAGFAEPAHPNPVTGSNRVVTFGYVTRVEGPISLVVYDVLGNEIARVVNNVRHAPGVYEVPFDVSRLASGTYSYRLTGPSFQGTRQFVVSK